MKKVVVLLFFVVLMGVLTAAPFTTSLLYDASFGIFETPIDAAGEAGESFLELDKTYFFGGLSNLNKNQVISATANTVAVPLTFSFGSYVHSDLPWSVFTNFWHDPTAAGSGGKTVTESYSTKTVGTTNYTWVDTQTERKSYGRMADEIDDSAQFVMTIGEMVVGGKIRITSVNSSPLVFNYKEETLNYVDDALPTAPPNTVVDYKRTIERRDSVKSFGTEITAPLFIPGDDFNQTISASVGFGTEHLGSRTWNITNTKPVKVPTTLTNTMHDDIKDKEGFFNVSGSYRMDTTSPFIDSNSKDFYYGGTLRITSRSKAYKTEVERQTYTYTLSGTTMTETPGNYTYNSQEHDYGASMDFNLQGMAGHRFNYDFGNGLTIAMDPRVNIALNVANQPSLKQVVTTVKTDSNNDGVVDTTTVTTVDYKNTVNDAILGVTDKESITTYIIGIAPACALQFQPEKWKVGFTYGAKFDAQLQLTSEKTKQSYSYTETVTTTGTTSTTTNLEAYSGSTVGTTNTVQWISLLQHNFGIHVDITDNATLLADLSANVTGGILDLGRLTVQAIIAIP